MLFIQEGLQQDTRQQFEDAIQTADQGGMQEAQEQGGKLSTYVAIL